LQAASGQARRAAAKVNGRAGKGRLRIGAPNRVLMFGKIRELALYRAEVLRSHGFNVVIPASKADAIAAIRRGGYDVCVLTYTLSNETVEELAELVRQHCPDCRLITISETRNSDPKINPDLNVVADDGPQALLEALRAIVKH
jgi:hypothetical protein